MTITVKGLPAFSLYLLAITAAQAESFEVTVKVQSEIKAPNEILGAVSPGIITTLQGLPSRTSAQSHLLDTLTLIETANADEELRGYMAISPKSASAETSSITSQASGFSLQGIGNQLSIFRNKTRNNSFRFTPRKSRSGIPRGWIYHLNEDPLTGSQSAGGIFDNKLSGFFNADYSSLSKENNSQSAGFTSDSQQVTAGADYRHTLNLYTGAVFIYSRSSGELNQNTGSLDGQNVAANVFGGYFKDNLSVEAFANASRLGFDLKRNINFTVGATPIVEVAKSSPKGTQLGGGIKGNFDHVLRDGTSFTASLGLNANLTDIDSFSETGGNGLALKVDKQRIATLNSEVTLLASRAISATWSVIIPQISATWLHEYIADGSTITGRFIHDPSGTPFGFETEQRDADYIIASAGASALFPAGLVVFGQVTQVYLQTNYSRYTVSAGVRKEF